jgi:antitoxin (DNA-binding transcriptional repressor) of toxin-antitoxin stability system
MWILPKNYPLSSRFAQDMVESKEDLTLPGLNIESSLMWRSKPSPLRTWSTRWKQGSYLPHLFTRILKPSQRTSFETALTSSLEVIRASRFQQQDSEREPMIHDTCGLTLGDTLKQLDLLDASLKMSMDTYRLDSPQSLATWKKMVTEQRGEYSLRLKSAHLTRESESISWPTEEKFPTPGTTECRSDTLNLVNRVSKGKQVMLTHHVRLYPTPSARDWKDTAGMAKTATNPDGSERKRNDQLARAVYATENPISGNLNPDWVEWLMGVPTGWTELGCWEMQ